MTEWNWALDSDGGYVIFGAIMMGLGLWILGKGNDSKGPLADGIGGIWTAVNFGMVLTFGGALLGLSRLAYAGDAGYGITDNAEVAGWIGLAALVCATIAASSLAMIDRGPKIIGNGVGIAVAGLLFAQSFSAAGGTELFGMGDSFLGMDLPLWPMNAILAGAFSLVHGLALAMLLADAIKNTRKLAE